MSGWGLVEESFLGCCAQDVGHRVAAACAVNTRAHRNVVSKAVHDLVAQEELCVHREQGSRSAVRTRWRSQSEGAGSG